MDAEAQDRWRWMCTQLAARASGRVGGISMMLVFSGFAILQTPS